MAAVEVLNVCKICLLSNAKYTCPRCNMEYCSLQCYQSEKHSNCSEAFYKDCVVRELSEISNDPEDKQKVLDMLARDLDKRAEEDDGESSEEDLTERVKGLDLDKDIAKVWSRLNPKEKEDFARMLQDGSLAQLIVLWTPWWRCKENQKLVHENGSSHGGMPDIPALIPDINGLLKNRRPSSECKFDLLNVLFCYAFVTRIHNGGHFECLMDSTQDVLQSCFVLRDQNRCGSVGEAIQKGLDDVSSKEQKCGGNSADFYLTLVEDVHRLVTGPGNSSSLIFVSAALSDLLSLLQDAFRLIRQELRCKKRDGEDDSELSNLKSSVFRAEKKVSFLLSWTQRYGVAVQKLLPQLQFEIETRQAEAEQVSEIKEAIEENLDKLKPRDTESKTSESARPKIVEID